MNDKTTKKISKFLSYVLRHNPDKLDLTLDEQGWTSVEELLGKLNNVSMEQLEYVVANNNKKRFAFNNDKTQIRANQGHSIKIDLAYEAIKPPKFLYHGTATKNINSIQKSGIIKGSRHHVHLSADIDTATNVGQRHGKPVILIVKSIAMYERGYEFFLSENGVWLTDFIPTEFIDF
ncbi:MAG: RNA 2'-phosphotransferase [Saprospiraceae bacterium]